MARRRRLGGDHRRRLVEGKQSVQLALVPGLALAERLGRGLPLGLAPFEAVGHLVEPLRERAKLTALMAQPATRLQVAVRQASCRRHQPPDAPQDQEVAANPDDGRRQQRDREQPADAPGEHPVGVRERDVGRDADRDPGRLRLVARAGRPVERDERIQPPRAVRAGHLAGAFRPRTALAGQGLVAADAPGRTFGIGVARQDAAVRQQHVGERLRVARPRRRSA